MLAEAYQLMYSIVLVILGILLCACLIRLIAGPRIADRIIATNMMSTLIVIIICILAFMKHEGYLVDIAIIYTMLSFLAVVLLTKIYMGVWHDKHAAALKNETEDDSDD